MSAKRYQGFNIGRLTSSCSKIRAMVEVKHISEREKTYPLDAIVVLGSGIVKSKRAKFSYAPSTDGRLRAAAGAYLYLRGETPKLILTGGRILGAEHPSVAQVMAEFIMRKFKIPENVISIREEPMDTVQEIEEASRLRNKELKAIAVLSNRYHLERISLIADKLKIPLAAIAAEDILSEIPSEKEKARRFLSSPSYQKSVLREKELINQLSERLRTGLPHRRLDSKGKIRDNI